MGKSGVSPLFNIRKFLLSGSIDVDFFVEILPINTNLDGYFLHLSICFPYKTNSAPENIFIGFKLVMNQTTGVASARGFSSDCVQGLICDSCVPEFSYMLNNIFAIYFKTY